MTDKPDFITLNEFAARLGISKRTAERWRAEGRIRVFNVGSVVRVATNEIDRLMRSKPSRAA